MTNNYFIDYNNSSQELLTYYMIGPCPNCKALSQAGGGGPRVPLTWLGLFQIEALKYYFKQIACTCVVQAIIIIII